MKKKTTNLRITREEAGSILAKVETVCKEEEVDIEKSYGRVLSKDITADQNVPPFSRSPLDGYAFRGEDTMEASKDHPVVLKITEEIPAGGVPTIALTKGWTAKILTGAPIPEGCNAIQRYEEVEFDDEKVIFRSSVKPGSNIVLEGNDVKVGEKVADRGDIITPPLAGMLASLGYSKVPVYKKPKVAIISTGSELASPKEDLKPGKIHSSSYHMLRGYLEEAGAEVEENCIIPDRLEKITRMLDEKLREADMVITTGGVSVGDYDLMPDAADKIGAKRLFWKVRFRPGGSVLAAVKNGKLILGLSGNPTSAMLALHLLGMPFIRRLEGRPNELPEKIQVELLEPVTKDSPFGRLIRGRMVIREGRCCFQSVDYKGNGAISSVIGCDLIADIPQDTPPLAAGTIVDAYRITR